MFWLRKGTYSTCVNVLHVAQGFKRACPSYYSGVYEYFYGSGHVPQSLQSQLLAPLPLGPDGMEWRGMIWHGLSAREHDVAVFSPRRPLVWTSSPPQLPPRLNERPFVDAHAVFFFSFLVFLPQTTRRPKRQRALGGVSPGPSDPLISLELQELAWFNGVLVLVLSARAGWVETCRRAQCRRGTDRTYLAERGGVFPTCFVGGTRLTKISCWTPFREAHPRSVLESLCRRVLQRALREAWCGTADFRETGLASSASVGV